MSHEVTVQTQFCEELNWKEIYVSAAQVTNNAYLLQTQFKLTHNILPTNYKLYVWKIEPSPHCICGIVDTNLHYSVTCKLIQPFWGKILNFIKVTLEVSFPISDKEKFFGIENAQNESTIDAINYILLTAKVFIWREKRWGKPCTLHDYLPYLREQILLDAATQTLKKKPFLMDLLDIT